MSTLLLSLFWSSSSVAVLLESLCLRFFFSFLILPLPRRSPLFPYTTLFRSDQAVAAFDQREHRLAFADAAFAADDQDRKSTRLNSSHRCISYAVFCLKKKNGATLCRGYTVPRR